MSSVRGFKHGYKKEDIFLNEYLCEDLGISDTALLEIKHRLGFKNGPITTEEEVEMIERVIEGVTKVYGKCTTNAIIKFDRNYYIENWARQVAPGVEG